MSLSVFFFAEPHFRLCQAAEEAGSADVTVFPREQEFKQCQGTLFVKALVQVIELYI